MFAVAVATTTGERNSGLTGWLHGQTTQEAAPHLFDILTVIPEKLSKAEDGGTRSILATELGWETYKER
jgi:hypothetical protein